jgi:transcriptional regulator with XRE-family HTH domain
MKHARSEIHPLVAELQSAAKNVKQISLAVKSGFSAATVSSFMTGARRPSIWALTALADALGYDVVLRKRRP